jgi:hypothetical protein
VITTHAALDEVSRRLMADIGPVWGEDIQKHRDMVLRAYGPALKAAPKAGITVTRDIAYGSHRRQILDLFVPVDAAGAPVVVFVHGGAYVRGDKRVSSEVYDNVLYWFAREGFIGVNIEYRLAPEVTWPGGAEDLRSGDRLDPRQRRAAWRRPGLDFLHRPLVGRPGGDQRHVADAAAEVEHPHPRPDAGPHQHVLGQVAIVVPLALQPPELVVRVAEGIGTVGLRAGLAGESGTPDHGLLLGERRKDARPRRRDRASG